MELFRNAKLIDQLITYLTRFITSERERKLLDVLHQRTRYITVVLEDLYQTQNMSAVLRSCECYGVQDIHIIENSNEFKIHHAISMGADKWLSLHNYENSSHNLQDCVLGLREKGYQIIATSLTSDAIPIQDLPIDQPLAFCFGTELTGLSKECLQLADRHVTIPMYGFTESLNISNAVAITLSYIIEKIRKANVPWELSDEERKHLYLEWLQTSIRDSSWIIQDFLSQIDNKKEC